MMLVVAVVVLLQLEELVLMFQLQLLHLHSEKVVMVQPLQLMAHQQLMLVVAVVEQKRVVV
jgi:hypothetical protein